MGHFYLFCYKISLIGALIGLISFPVSLTAQNCPDYVEANELISKHSSDYYFGRSTHVQKEKARQLAFEQLLERFPRRVTQSVSTSFSENANSADQDYFQSFSNKTGIMLESLHVAVCEDAGSWYYVMYLKKTDFEDSQKSFETYLINQTQFADSLFDSSDLNRAAKTYFEVQTLLKTYFTGKKPLYKNIPIEQYLIEKNRIIEKKITVHCEVVLKKESGPELVFNLFLGQEELDSWQVNLVYENKTLTDTRIDFKHFSYIWNNSVNRVKPTLELNLNAYDPLRFEQFDYLSSINRKPETFVFNKKVTVDFSSWIEKDVEIKLYKGDNSGKTIETELFTKGLAYDSYTIDFGDSYKEKKLSSARTAYHSYTDAGEYTIKLTIGTLDELSLQKKIRLDGKGNLFFDTEVETSTLLKTLESLLQETITEKEFKTKLKRIQQNFQPLTSSDIYDFDINKVGDKLLGIAYDRNTNKVELLRYKNNAVIQYQTGSLYSSTTSQVIWLLP
jgi:hypothetical protein